MESEQVRLRSRELAELKGEKERREEDTAKTGELRAVAESLRTEVDMRAMQARKLQADSNETHRCVESQVQTSLLTMGGDVAALGERCERG
jgi:hypothetical protein